MKRLAHLCLLMAATVSAAYAQKPAQNWFERDKASDTVQGVSSNKALSELLKGKQSQTVIVAVIDGGTDPYHPDLKANMWVNPKEIPGNNIDDDKNGYVDDINGWDFIGGKDGQDVKQDNLELTRLYRELKPKYEGKTTVAPEQMAEFTKYKLVAEDYNKRNDAATQNFQGYAKLAKAFDQLKADLGGRTDFTLEELTALKPQDPSVIRAQAITADYMRKGMPAKDLFDQIQEGYDHYKTEKEYQLGLEFDPRSIVGDNYADVNEKYYGNNEVKGPEALHGTHVAGIIGAVRNNSEGMDGVADNVRLMVVRVVPDGDERDKDVANGIRYAVDNGAKVINMSFGKSYSYNKKIVDEAVQYAMSKDVLLIHAAGNDGQNNDKNTNVPNKNFESGGQAANWIEVGASTPSGDPASFSNYGKKSVDVFAPGVDIYATAPDNAYKWLQGTSMASPVVAGVAAMIRSYYPSLKAEEVKQIIMSSVVKVKGKRPQPMTDEEVEAARMKSLKKSKPGEVSVVKIKTPKTKYKKLCVSGGIVNAYKAVQLAEKKTSK